jgi:hypothetical protein
MDTTIIDTMACCADTVATLVENPAVAVEVVEEASMSVIDFILGNWGELLIGILAFAKIVVNLTPTTADNAVFGWIDTFISTIINDRRKS